jgi:pimeloyl-ACP methyl ester carboxylesterase
MPPGPQGDIARVEVLRSTLTPAATATAASPSAGSDAPAISLLRAGDARGPRLILVHGTPGDAASWADYLLDPPPGTDVVALDRPGFGASGPEGAVPGLAEQAAAVAALLPSDGRRVVLLGHSLGGPVVARVAAEHPGRIHAVVLLAASLDPALETIHPLQRVGAWPWVQWLLPRPIRNANAELLALREELLALQPLLANIRARVLIVHGDADNLVPVANVPYMQARLSGAACVQTTLLVGADHFLPWNARASVRGALRQALEGTC